VTDDDGPHYHGFLHDTDACIVTSTDEAHQSTPDGAYESAHHTRATRRQLQLVAHPDDAHLRDSHHGVRYGAHEAVNSARRRESDNDVGAHSNAPGCEPPPTDDGDGRTRRHHRRQSSSTSDADDTSPEVRRRHRIKPRIFDGTHYAFVRLVLGTVRELRILQPMERCGQVGASESFRDR